MPNGTAARFSQLCVALNLTVPDFAGILKEPLPRLERLLAGKGRVSPRLQAQVLDQFPAVNPSWLLTGEGTMFRVQPQLPSAPGANNVGANYGQNIQIINPPCRCCCTINALKDHLREKERVIQLLLQQIPHTQTATELQ